MQESRAIVVDTDDGPVYLGSIDIEAPDNRSLPAKIGEGIVLMFVYILYGIIAAWIWLTGRK
jgi:hypothetical protein